MKKRWKIIIIISGFFFSVLLYFLPDFLFNNDLSKEEIYQETLDFDKSSSLEDILIQSKTVSLDNDEVHNNLQTVTEHRDELEKLFQALSLPLQELAIQKDETKVVAQTIYWTINFTSKQGYGFALIENKTNKVVQLRYFPDEDLQNVSANKIVKDYFQYLGITIKAMETNEAAFISAELTTNQKINFFIDPYRLIINDSQKAA
jgi:hypothetical protein